MKSEREPTLVSLSHRWKVQLSFLILLQMDLGQIYTALFVRKRINDGGDFDDDLFEIPTLHMILLYLEWFMPPSKLEAISKLVYQNVRKKKINKADDFLEVFNTLADGDNFVNELRSIAGRELYDYACAAIGDGEVAIPLGLAPTYRLFESGCLNCSTPKYIRSFCLRCGILHEADNRVTYSRLTNRSRVSRKVKSVKTMHIKVQEKSESVFEKSIDEPSALLPSSSSSVTAALSNLSGLSHNASPSMSTITSDSSVAQPNGVLPKKVQLISLQKLMELSRQKKLLSESLTSAASQKIVNVAVASSTVEGVEIVTYKAEPIVIDLVSDSDDSESGSRSSRRSQPLTLPVDTPKQSIPPPGLSSPALLHHTKSSALAAAVVSIKLEKSSSYGSFMSECNSTIDSGELDGYAGDLAPVKLEWPAQRMNKYEMAAMRGT